MKWLIILVLLLILAAFIAVRFRRQITTGIQIFKMLRQLRSQMKPPEKKIEKQSAEKTAPLVRCARCGTWTPQATALNLRSKIFYCSPNCMEKAVNLNNA
jgi:hypothetical protein